MTTTQTAALTKFLDVFSVHYLATDVAHLLTCDEADALIDLLEANGRDASTWRDAHAQGDEYGDRHDRGDHEDRCNPCSCP